MSTQAQMTLTVHHISTSFLPTHHRTRLNILHLALTRRSTNLREWRRSMLGEHAIGSLLKKSMLHPVDPYGLLTQLYAGTSPDVLHSENGAFLIPWARNGPTPPGALKAGVGRKLWEYVEKEVEGH
ncbi:hypothetical protein B0H13DRAFT_2344122 [Mycena leptocephala]|nr:hypothetical protein B0H13DRAFT_2344122 [Mycena leptocephala]